MKARNKRKSQWIALLWLALPISVVAVFCVYPAAVAIVRSFMEWTPAHSRWIWLENFTGLFGDPLFWKAFRNMGILLLCNLVTSNVMTLTLAELLFNLKFKKTEKVLRYLFLLPALVPGMVTVLLWRNVILSGADEGLMNVILAMFGARPGAWYYDKSTVLLSLVLTGFPWVGGVSFLIYLSGLQAIPESVYEAARLDGISPLRRVFCIDLPFLVGQIKYFIIIGVINGVQVYDLQLILGFSALDPASTVPGYLMYYHTLGTNRYGYAASIGVVLFVITLAVSVLSNKISEKMQKENGL